MKFGVCTNLLPHEPGSAGAQWIDAAARLDYDYVELPLGEITQMTPSAFSRLKRTISDAAIPCYACNNFMPNTLKIVGPDASEKECQNHCERAISAAAELGAKIVGLGSPWSKRIPDGFSRDAAFSQMAHLCGFAAETAKQAGITVALEHNNHTETNFLNQFHEVAALAQAVHHPNLLLLADYYHFRVEDESLSNVTQCGSLLAHAHFARFEKRGYPASLSEDQNYQVFADVLQTCQYTGGLSIEAFTKHFQDDGAKTLAFFRTLFHMPQAST